MKRSKKLNICLTEEEYQKLMAKSKQEYDGISTTAWKMVKRFLDRY